MPKINSQNDLRGAVSLTTTGIYDMCNAKTLTELIERFNDVSNLIVDIYRYKVEELRDHV